MKLCVFNGAKCNCSSEYVCLRQNINILHTDLLFAEIKMLTGLIKVRDDKLKSSKNGELMDGRHRIMKTMLLGIETIKAVRFDINPQPCSVSE